MPTAAATASPIPRLDRRFLEPPGFAWGIFTTTDGAALRWGHLAAPAPWAQCVLVGGFTEFVEKYFETMGDLVARGLSVWCLDWRGQGGSQRPRVLPARPRPRSFDRDASDLAASTETVVRDGGPCILIAHSMGGAIALLCMHAHRNLFAAAVLSAPMLGLATGGIKLRTARLITAAASLSGLGSMLVPGARHWHSDSSHSPARSRTSSDSERFRVHQAWLASRPELTVDGPTYGWLNAAFRLAERVQRDEFLARIETPILIGSAGIESFVDPQAHHRAVARLRDSALVELPHSKHEPFLETDAIRDRWFAAIDRFLDDRFPRPERLKRRAD